MVKISVIFPVFNVEYYVEEALDSLVNQTIFEEIEIIIVDDQSTDKSRYIINKYAIDYDNIFIIRQKNSGVSTARNYGMKIAKGEYIAFMDSDDFILYDTYEKLYNFAKKEEYDVVSGPFLRFNSEKTWQETISKYVYENIKENIENVILPQYTNLTWDTLVWNKIYKREFLEKNDFRFIDGLVTQDAIFSIEVLYKASKIGILADFVHCWREREKGTSVTQTKNLKRATDNIQVYHLVHNIVKNIPNKDILEKKYLKWQIIDIKYFFELIQEVPEENREFLCESIYEIYNLIPKGFRENLNTYYTVLYKMLNNKDWESLFLYYSNNYKTNPVLPEGLQEEYVQLIDFKEDAKGEELDTYASDVYQDGEKIVIKFKNYIPYLEKSDDEEVSIRMLNSSQDDVYIESDCIEKDRFSIPIDMIPLGESILITTFKSQGIKKEYYMKTNSRRSYSYDDVDVEIARGKTSYLRLIKREKDNSDYAINEVNFRDEEYIEFKGISNNNQDGILINDYLDFYKFKYQINYEKTEKNDLNEYEFELKIPYKDLLKVPVKKWDVYIYNEFNKVNLDKNYEFINEKYRIYVKNYGNRFVIELIRYDPLETIINLNSDKNRLIKEKQNLTKDKEQLTQDKNKLIEEKNQLNSYNEKLAKDKKQLTKDKDKLLKDKEKLTKDKERLKEKNKNLKDKVEAYKNRKDVKTVDAIKRAMKR